MQSWKETRLWKSCVQQEGIHQNILINIMPRIEEVLRSGGTIPLDFTLHDSEHSYRVAERMFDLCPDLERERLSVYEVALLLLAAYLHDIGMAPNRSSVDALKTYVVSGDFTSMTFREKQDFDDWLDTDRPEVELPLIDTISKSDLLTSSEEIVAYYIRHKHNDWSGSWIRDNLTQADQLYPGSIDDLVGLCQSHHEGLNALKHERFNARLIGSQGEVVNLRYLCALLRLADVMEFDPERTPEVVMKHRAIKPRSRIYWWKDHYIKCALTPQTGEIIFTARTPNPIIHKAVLETASMIDAELQCCKALEEENLFNRGKIPQSARNYEWHWLSKMTVDIEAADNSFEYISGNFRPDLKRILDLLSGTALYGNRFAAIRELMQNAFDAVRQQIAYERLNQDKPEDLRWEKEIGNRHKVTLTFSERDQRCFLTCVDDGVGMTKDIIDKHLLVSGSRPHAETQKLERRAKQHGFITGQTGNFGVGFLSYFMIADKIIVTTKRSAETGGDPQNLSWKFETEGISEFGQLTPLVTKTEGSAVELRLLPDFVGEDSKFWFEQLKTYVLETLSWLPCRFEIRSEDGGFTPVKLDSGWSPRTFGADQFLKNFRDLEEMTNPDPNKRELVPQAEIEHAEILRKKWEEARARATSQIQFIKHEDILPDGLGRFHIQIPYFSLPSGASLAFFNDSEGQFKFLANREMISVPTGATHHSWRGFRVTTATSSSFDKASARVQRVIGEALPAGSFFVGIDWFAKAEISVDRTQLHLGEDCLVAHKVIEERIVELYTQFLISNKAARAATLNRSIVLRSFSLKSDVLPQTWAWPSIEPVGQGIFKMDDLWFPAIEISRVNSVARSSEIEQIKNAGFSCAQTLEVGRYPSLNLNAFRNLNDGKFLLLKYRHGLSICPVWEDSVSPQTCFIDFPPEWNTVWSVGSERIYYFNKNHPLSAALIAKGVVSNHISFPFIDFENVAHMPPYEEVDRTELNVWLFTKFRSGVRFWNAIRDHKACLYNFVLKLMGGLGASNATDVSVPELQTLDLLQKRPHDAVLFKLGQEGPESENINFGVGTSGESHRSLPWPEKNKWVVFLEDKTDR